MADNKHGYTAQDEFQVRWKALGKRAWLHRFNDASDLFGRNKRLVMANPQPADFLCACEGWLGLIEIKATKNLLGFPVSMVARPQLIAATHCMAAEVNYSFAIKREATKEWFIAPARFVIDVKGTIKWQSLLPYIWLEDRDAFVRSLYGGHRDHRLVA